MEEKIAHIWWEKADCENALELREIPVTEENIRALWEAMDANKDRIVEAMCMAGWDVVYDILDDVAISGDLYLTANEEE